MRKRKTSPITPKSPNNRSFQSLRNIEPSLESKLKSIGVNNIADFMKANPLELYYNLESMSGSHIDRCVLYCFKGAKLDLQWYECKKYFLIDNSGKVIREKALRSNTDSR